MSNGLITSFLSTSCSRNDVCKVENEETSRKSHEEDSKDLTGLLATASGDGKMKTKKKRKRRHRQKGHVHLAKLSEKDNVISMEENSVSISIESATCDEVTCVIAPEEDQEPTTKPTVNQQHQLLVGAGKCQSESSGARTMLSDSWKHVFCRMQKKLPVKKLAGSPKRCKSPRQPAVSPKMCRSLGQPSTLPKRCRSPQQRSVERVRQLKQQHNVKRQLLTTPTNRSSQVDHAPFTGLVHVRQDSMIRGNLVQNPLTLPLRSIQPFTPPAVINFSLGLSDYRPLPLTTPFFETITDLSCSLDQLQRDHPSLCVSDIYARYYSLTRQSGSSFDDHSLRCSISVRVETDRKITVESSAYPKPSQLQDHMHSDLWSSVYRPQNTSEVIGNRRQSSELCTWLKRWKNRSSSQDTQSITTKEKVSRKKCSKYRKVNGWWENDDDKDFVPPRKVNMSKGRSGLCQRYLAGDNESSEGESEEEGEMKEDMTSVMLLCGPPGSGKTSSVYASADQLGFRVRKSFSKAFIHRKVAIHGSGRFYQSKVAFLFFLIIGEKVPEVLVAGHDFYAHNNSITVFFIYNLGV